jgi:hypothetical protein
MLVVRRTGAALAVAAALGVPFACGGESSEISGGLPATIANQLAQRSDAAAEKLDSGDSCGAREEVEHLQTELTAAVSAGRIQDAVGRQLQAVVSRLLSQVSCEPEVTTTETETKPKSKPRPEPPAPDNSGPGGGGGGGTTTPTTTTDSGGTG